MAKARKGEFQIYRGEDDKIRFRLVAGNGEIIASGEGYEGRRAVDRGIELLKSCADWPVVDQTYMKKPPKEPSPQKPKEPTQRELDNRTE